MKLKIIDDKFFQFYKEKDTLNDGYYFYIKDISALMYYQSQTSKLFGFDIICFGNYYSISDVELSDEEFNKAVTLWMKTK